MTMSNDEYMRTQSTIVLVGTLVRSLDLPGFLSRIELAEALGPITDPSLYREAGPKLHEIKNAAQLLLPLNKALRGSGPEALEQCPVTQFHCSICGEVQFDTPSGRTCKNEHGGAPSRE